MKRIIIFGVLAFTCLWLLFSGAFTEKSIDSKDSRSTVPIQEPDNIRVPNMHPGAKVDRDFAKTPLYFVFNKGQVNRKATFYAKAPRYTLWLTGEGLVLDGTRRIGDKKQDKDPLHTGGPMGENGNRGSVKHERDVSRLVFLDAEKNPQMVPLDETQLKVNVFKGNDKSKWKCDIPTAGAVLYKSLYKNIDLKVYGLEKQVEYDWIVKPKGDPGAIRFQYRNVKGSRIDKEGNLLVETDFGEMMHKKPVSYQLPKHAPLGGAEATTRALPQERENVDVTFKKIAENSYAFNVGSYDTGRELIIDPVVLAYSTYLGGGDADYATDIAVDAGGKVYVTGYTLSTDFPVLDHYQAADLEEDIFIAKFDPTKSGASSLLYSTYLGGTDEDIGYGIAADASGKVYLTGRTRSSNFPILDQYQADQYVDDVFVTVLDTTVAGAAGLIYSTYLGGSVMDYGRDIVVDSTGKVYVAGSTWSSDFPNLNQYQTMQGSINAFVSKLDPTKSGASSLLYSTHLGGERWSYGFAIAADDAGNAYVTGYTHSTNFPLLNEFHTDRGNHDIFVSRLDTTLSGTSSLIYSTYLGGEWQDYGYAIAVRDNGIVYIAGFTDSWYFPTRNAYQDYPGYPDARNAIFAVLDTSLSGDASLLYSTYLGGINTDFACAYGIAVDAAGCAYVAGEIVGEGFPTRNHFQTAQGNFDAFVTKLDPTRSGDESLLYSTYLGGSNADYCKGIVIDTAGNAYVTGHTLSTNFPVHNRYQSSRAVEDAYVSRLYFSKSSGYYYCHGSDYNGDTIDDIAVYSRSNGSWEVRGSASTAWGISTDTPVPGDYNGDGTTDKAIFRPSKGLWAILGQPSTAWGTVLDIPVPGDYDGNGTTDIAIFRPSTGRWCIRGQASIAWGTSGDIPVPADYDGNGTTDIAIFRPSTGRWCIRGQASIAWGTPGDIPIAADYDGDGDTDIAIFRPSTGRWCIRGQASIAWGTPGDVPVPADYDGDGDADITIFRPSLGLWAVKGSPSVVFGTSTDIPLVSHSEK
ncbi:MAG: hypothetical protein GY765_05625 [bacterium]|nr:hypothetical protein [bacterium]